MAHHCIKYRLTPDGTIPNFLYMGQDGVGGMYPVSTPGGTNAFDDFVMIGISSGNDFAPAEEVLTQADLEVYLSEVGADWFEPSLETPESPKPFDPAAAAAWVWGRLEALNAA